MDASLLNVEENQPRLKVSAAARLIAAFSYTIPLIGGALSSFILSRNLRDMSLNEAAGIGVVMASMEEARGPAIISLYLAAICGIVVIVVLVVRMFGQTKTAPPPFWFFGIGGILCLVPAGLFWKADLLVLEALSLGRPFAADGAGVGADINGLVTFSIIAAPIVFIFLLVTSFWPSSSRATGNWSSLITAVAIEILLIATAIAVPYFINEPKRRNQTVNLPVNAKKTVSDVGIERASSMVLILTSDNKLYLEQKQSLPGKAERTENLITKEELPEKLRKFFETKSPDERIVYLKADINASYANVQQVFEVISKAEIEMVGLVVFGVKSESDPYQISPSMFEVKLPAPPDISNVMPRPNPLKLVAMLDDEGKLKLNNDEMGTISDPKKLISRLASIFDDRENNGIFREGTNEVEKSVSLRASKSAKYGDFIKLVEAVKVAAAQPIEVEMDDGSSQLREAK